MLSTGALDKLFSTRDQSVIEERMMFSECHPVHYTTIGRKRKRKRKFLQKFRISPNQLCVLGLFKDKATADLELQYINSCITSGYATMVHGRGCNPHRSTTAFANLEITSLWRHWWRHNSETIRDREKGRPPRAMKSSKLFNGENRIALRQLLQNQKWRHWWRHNLGSRWKLQKNGSREFLVLVRSTI